MELKIKLNIFNFSTIATILIITGTHGTEAGVSGLTDMDRLDHFFYVEDCQMVGVKNGPDRRRVPIDSSEWNTRVPMMTKPAEKLDPLPPGCFYQDDVLKTMDIRVANMAYYHGHSQKLLDDITELNPAVVILAFCYSINSDVSMLLRSNGTFSSMILNHDLKVITGNPLAEMNHVQKDLLAEIGLIFSRHQENESSFNVSS